MTKVINLNTKIGCQHGASQSHCPRTLLSGFAEPAIRLAPVKELLHRIMYSRELSCETRIQKCCERLPLSRNSLEWIRWIHFGDGNNSSGEVLELLSVLRSVISDHQTTHPYCRQQNHPRSERKDRCGLLAFSKSWLSTPP